MSTKVMRCEGRCKPHAFQDAEYGVGMRVHNGNMGPNKVKDSGWACTVCGHGLRPRSPTSSNYRERR